MLRKNLHQSLNHANHEEMDMRKLTKTLLAIAVGSTLVIGPLHAAVGDSADATYEAWQAKRLFQPTERQLHQERMGKIFIYDGLKETYVARALEEQFDRVGSMMFVNVVVTDAQGQPKADPESGEVVTQDDGC
jgi:hypothetical protein